MLVFAGPLNSADGSNVTLLSGLRKKWDKKFMGAEELTNLRTGYESDHQYAVLAIQKLVKAARFRRKLRERNNKSVDTNVGSIPAAAADPAANGSRSPDSMDEAAAGE